MTASPRRPARRVHRLARRVHRLARRAETWMWTGPAGHLLGGTLDFVQTLWRYERSRLRRSRQPQS